MWGDEFILHNFGQITLCWSASARLGNSVPSYGHELKLSRHTKRNKVWTLEFLPFEHNSNGIFLIENHALFHIIALLKFYFLKNELYNMGHLPASCLSWCYAGPV